MVNASASQGDNPMQGPCQGDIGSTENTSQSNMVNTGHNNFSGYTSGMNTDHNNNTRYLAADGVNSGGQTNPGGTT